MYYTSAPEVAQESSPTINIYAIPENIDRALRSNNLNTIDIPTYSKVRSVCSLDDMAFLARLNEELKIDGDRIASYSPDLFMTNHTPAEQQEFNGSVLPLSRTEEVAKAVAAYVNAGDQPNTDFYILKSIGPTVLIVVKPGFMKSLEDKDCKKAFLKDVMKKCESVGSMDAAARTSLFRHFLSSTTCN